MKQKKDRLLFRFICFNRFLYFSIGWNPWYYGCNYFISVFINCSSHDNMSYKIRSAVYLTCFIHHILFKELNKMFKTRVGYFKTRVGI